jgi:hypothetical protein
VTGVVNEFRRIPEPLQRQTLLRLGLGAAFLALLIALLAVARDIYLWLPCAGIVIFHAVSASLLFHTAVTGGYVAVTGKCSEAGLTTIRRRSKFIILQTEAGAVRVMLRNKLRRISPGTEVTLYIAKKSQVYKQNGEKILYNYLALELL